MCGIVGYVGPKNAIPVMLDGLTRLEYRGYDSAGVAVLNGHGLETRKLAGRVQGLRDLLGRSPVQGSCGIGHTRWATHGAPNDCNAHPHLDCSGALALVHNGIIENADVLRARLIRSEEHTSELQSRSDLVCRLLLEKKKNKRTCEQSEGSHISSQAANRRRLRCHTYTYPNLMYFQHSHRAALHRCSSTVYGHRAIMC